MMCLVTRCCVAVQVYVRGELLGGCDIVLEMHEAGELKDTIDEMKARL
jgi:glutaredoxin-related protein